ncbi:hypothetical protein [Reichenbachiella sp. 5M10]|uniref:hypothetical protein n=1 Tax=Reichenbachiella sp. 5M10 TaxID=1889772 RepID=UPI00117B1951|nr:hypothetical protein [Reichenbachiella sp. 5M10]
MQSRSMAHQASMGGVGIAAPNFYHINSMNPALLTYNVLSVFELGLQGEYRTSNSGLDKQKTGSGGFNYLSFAFPVLYDRMTTNIGVRPYSVVNYNFVTSGPVIGNPDVENIAERTGEGGITEVYWSNGIKVVGDLSVGVRASFLFGFTQDDQKIILSGDDISSQIPTGAAEKTNYKGFTFGFGAAYRLKLDEKKNLNFGVIYDLSHELAGDRLARQVSYAGNVTIPGDTLQNLTYSSTFDLPSELGIGISYEYRNRLIVALDLTHTDWKEDAQFGHNSALKYRKTYRAGLGIELTPKYNDVDSYLSRVRYRFGLSYEQLPYLSAGHKIDDYGITFGWSLPVKAVSALNMSFKYGQRGTKEDGLVKESYFKLIVGVTLNDRWFIKRKYN